MQAINFNIQDNVLPENSGKISKSVNNTEKYPSSFENMVKNAFGGSSTELDGENFDLDSNKSFYIVFEQNKLNVKNNRAEFLKKEKLENLKEISANSPQKKKAENTNILQKSDFASKLKVNSKKKREQKEVNISNQEIHEFIGNNAENVSGVQLKEFFNKKDNALEENIKITESAVLIESLLEESIPLKTPNDFLEMKLDTLEIKEKEEENKKNRKFSFDKTGKITVSDLRAEKTTLESSSYSKISVPEKTVSEIKYTGTDSAEITMTLSQNADKNILSLNNQSAAADGSNFQAMLANQIRQNVPEFVKAGSIVLKDKDSGSIKLILHPESLGDVKIDLQISEKNITGRILVASKEAYDAFKESAGSLKQAFIQSGFESAGFDLAMAGNGSFSNGFANRQDDGVAEFVMNKTYGILKEEADSVSNVISSNFSVQNTVNIVA